jgi:hypothetical protein
MVFNVAAIAAAHNSRSSDLGFITNEIPITGSGEHRYYLIVTKYYTYPEVVFLTKTAFKVVKVAEQTLAKSHMISFLAKEGLEKLRELTINEYLPKVDQLDLWQEVEQEVRELYINKVQSDYGVSFTDQLGSPTVVTKWRVDQEFTKSDGQSQCITVLSN